MLNERYTSQTIEVFNAGVAGNRAQEDRGRLIDMIRETKPEVLLLLEGANDLNGREMEINNTIGALEQMIGEGVSRGVRVFLATLPPQRPGGRNAGAAPFLDTVNALIRRTAPDEGAALVDVFAGMDLSMIGQDGLHPTDAGYQRMAEIWMDALKAAYEQPPAEGTASSTGAQQRYAITSVAAGLAPPLLPPH
jgi:lysophospholipase L1-like esterase